jgi:hypothetical protein
MGHLSTAMRQRVMSCSQDGRIQTALYIYMCVMLNRELNGCLLLNGCQDNFNFLNDRVSIKTSIIPQKCHFAQALNILADPKSNYFSPSLTTRGLRNDIIFMFVVNVNHVFMDFSHFIIFDWETV